MAFAKNTRTGKTVTVPEHYIGHPVLGKDLIVVTDKVEAAPKKEKKKKAKAVEIQEFSWMSSVEETEEQPAPEINIENEE